MKPKIVVFIFAALLLIGCGPTAEEKAEAAKRNLIDLCKDDLRAGLKDPHSLRVLGAKARFMDGVQTGKTVPDWDAGARVEYTATNSYGGRTRGIWLCNQRWLWFFRRS